MLRYILLILMIPSVFLSSSYGQSTKYFDENNVPIKKSKFKKKIEYEAYFSIPGDSAHHKRLIPRSVTNNIENKEVLLDLLEKAIGKSINRNVPTVIIYYPGLDRYNAPDNNREWLAYRHQELVTKLNKIGNTKPIYIYKDYDGLQKYKGVMTWYKDPYQVIEQKFFKHHYPDGSFVVIGKDGTCISYKGEYAIEQVVDAAKELYEKSR